MYVYLKGGNRSIAKILFLYFYFESSFLHYISWVFNFMMLSAVVMRFVRRLCIGQTHYFLS